MRTADSQIQDQMLMVYRKSMRRFRKLAIWLILPAICYFIVSEFMLEILALGWHARHGMNARLRNFDGKAFSVQVPMLWLAIVDDGGWNMGIAKKPGRIRASLRDSAWAMMSFSVAPTYLTANEMRSGASTMYSKAGIVLSEVTSVNVAGQGLYCFEQKWEKGKLAELTRNYQAVDLLCAPESDKYGFSATYTGSRDLVPEFYKALRGVTREQTVARH